MNLPFYFLCSNIKLTHREFTVLKQICPGKCVLGLQVHREDPGMAAGHSLGGTRGGGVLCLRYLGGLGSGGKQLLLCLQQQQQLRGHLSLPLGVFGLFKKKIEELQKQMVSVGMSSSIWRITAKGVGEFHKLKKSKKITSLVSLCTTPSSTMTLSSYLTSI